MNRKSFVLLADNNDHVSGVGQSESLWCFGNTFPLPFLIHCIRIASDDCRARVRICKASSLHPFIDSTAFVIGGILRDVCIGSVCVHLDMWTVIAITPTGRTIQCWPVRRHVCMPGTWTISVTGKVHKTTSTYKIIAASAFDVTEYRLMLYFCTRRKKEKKKTSSWIMVVPNSLVPVSPFYNLLLLEQRVKMFGTIRVHRMLMKSCVHLYVRSRRLARVGKHSERCAHCSYLPFTVLDITWMLKTRTVGACSCRFT